MDGYKRIGGGDLLTAGGGLICILGILALPAVLIGNYLFNVENFSEPGQANFCTVN